MEDLFFSDALKRKLEQVKTCALSVLEAPAGYGKTTAIRTILQDSETPVYWYTAVESMPDNSFRWFIRQVGTVDETAARGCRISVTSTAATRSRRRRLSPRCVPPRR